MKKIIIVLTIIGILLSGCQSRQSYSGICYDCGFDTSFNWIIYADNEEEYAEYVDLIRERANHYNQLFDIYHTYDHLNNIKSINDAAGQKPVQVDGDIIELLQLAKKVSELANGAFDITQGALLKVWHDAREKGRYLNDIGQYGQIPSAEALKEASLHYGFDHLIIDEQASTVYIDDPEMSLDVGGIAKGFAVEKIAEELKNKGLTNFSLVGGGNVKTYGRKIDGQAWNVGISDPRNSSDYTYDGLKVKVQNNESVVTSGNYFNFYLAEGNEKLHHIIDPSTLYPSEYYLSVTVICEDSGLGDALSTAFFNLSIDEGLQLKEKIQSAFDTSLEVLWILNTQHYNDDRCEKINGLSICQTANFDDYR